MKRFLSNVICVLTICAMVSFAGCGGDDKKDNKKEETKKEQKDESSDKK